MGLVSCMAAAIFDPVPNATGTTPTISPYKGDYFFKNLP